MTQYQAVAKTDDLSDGEMMAVSLEGQEILVVRVGDTFYAVANICTHQLGWLEQGELYSESLEVECPLHQGRFNLASGEPTRPPVIDPLRVYNVQVDGDDILVDIKG